MKRVAYYKIQKENSSYFVFVQRKFLFLKWHSQLAVRPTMMQALAYCTSHAKRQGAVAHQL